MAVTIIPYNIYRGGHGWILMNTMVRNSTVSLPRIHAWAYNNFRFVSLGSSRYAMYLAFPCPLYKETVRTESNGEQVDRNRQPAKVKRFSWI